MMAQILILSSLVVAHAHAGVQLQFEEPSGRGYKKDLIKIRCQVECALEVSGRENLKKLSSNKLLQEKVKLLIEADKPKDYEGSERLLLYKVSGSEGSKKFNLILGQPTSYEGDEFHKYTKFVSLLEEIKHIVFLETLPAGKK